MALCMINLIEKYNKNIPRYTSYPTAPMWSNDIAVQSYLSEIKKINKEDKFAIYIHLPFCKSLCNYCGCHVFIREDNQKIDPYIANLKLDIVNQVERIGHKLKVRQIHFGGGSPSFLSEEQITDLYDFLRQKIEIQVDAEIAIELDPRTTTIDKLSAYRRLGVNRVSFGVQDLNPDVQVEINRVQSLNHILLLHKHCKKLAFKSINFDLIYGLPKQDLVTFADTINKVIAIGPERIALFSYAHIPWLKKHQNKMNPETFPNQLLKINLLMEARKLLTNNGYISIGIDHFAKKEDSLSKAYKEKKLNRNFMGYTNQNVENILGFGVSSIGKINNYFFQNVKTLKEYDYYCKNTIPAIEKGMKLSLDDLIRQKIIMNIMCREELAFDEIEREFCIDFKSYFKDELKGLVVLEKDQLIIIEEAFIRVTSTGNYFLRNIASKFDKYLGLKPVKFSKAV
jgi:oxygen-independent coproporphyrinogen III oxidase